MQAAIRSIVTVLSRPNRRRLLAAAVVLLPFSSGLVSCGSAVGVGPAGAGEYSSVLVQTRDEALLRRTIAAVFAESGFESDGGGIGSMDFRKRGNRSAEIAWSTLQNPNPVYIRPSVTIRQAADGYRLTCDVYVTQASTTFGETVRQPLAAGKAGYQRMLNEVKKRVEKGG